MDSSLLPPTVDHNAPESNGAQDPPVLISSTTKYLSLELSELMPLINDNPAFINDD
jgi:hypothetical protein